MTLLLAGCAAQKSAPPPAAAAAAVNAAQLQQVMQNPNLSEEEKTRAQFYLQRQPNMGAASSSAPK